MDCFEIRQLVVVGIHANAEEEPRVSSVHELVIPELVIYQLQAHDERTPERTSTKLD